MLSPVLFRRESDFPLNRRTKMKSFRFLAVPVILTALLACHAFAQTPVIASISVKDTGCINKVGISTELCSLAPGMTIVIVGNNFGEATGGGSLCDCPSPTILKWSPTSITALINAVTPNSVLMVETRGGLWSNSVTYTALAPVITSIDVGNCTYIPDQSPLLCRITPGTQFTINGNYFGPQTIYSDVTTCDCTAATISSWNPTWTTSPSPFNNQIVATATDAVCGSTVAIIVNTMWSNYVAYTEC